MATLTIALMDSPYESGTTTTAMRIADAAVRKRHTVNIFAYEGAVTLTLKDQQAHANPIHGTSAEEEDHPSTARYVSGLFGIAGESNAKLDWINCGMCVDERGSAEWIEGPRRGGPADLYKWSTESVNTLIIGTR